MRGGQRKGAGRPRGAASKRTRAVADRESEKGLTPLEVMLKAMRQHASAKDWDAAASIAKDAAPYMHAKLASVQHTGRGGGPIQTQSITVDAEKIKDMTDDELDALERAIGKLQRSLGDGEGGEAEETGAS